MQSLIQTTQPTFASQVDKLLLLEAEAIAKAADRLQPEQVNQAVDLMINCSGKVVLSGVGKSGIVARKIAATLTSVGVMAVFLHPVEALHGDLGIVATTDVVVVLSNSGETDELIAMLPCLKQRQVPLIALVGNVNSTLADEADVVLAATVDQEACPMNLAPTASTTVAIAIGDALAMTVTHAKGVTPEAFAVNHPAGRLGKRLTIKVSDLMHQGSEHPCISSEASWLEIVTSISQGGLGAVNVVNAQQQLLGIVTDGDLRRAMEKIRPVDLEQMKAEKIMTANPITAAPDQLAYDALQVMEDRPSQISVLPVVDPDDRCVGVLRLHDIAQAGLI
ncbi:KpsF/GutQ family sugar-phosphate isomerase [Acaryochloris marina]|uniref:Sugar isomerase, KpsF/GutQ family n=1 Tax=Acaryochloris marina (strain MBIC 11017) TaxID=329726 RepID=B0BZZ6_ACAM1|nr:KpsF/GutQ family sugar-phosphate isomerase [Acaryochloris marina]ABW27206.1 sugar isomerase, KpsF/GutQ family [Acaryochloris marina MBIC11017]BDM81958.1 arabinose 5-phosphate isomerase [Acaryochloris marina MBIC10699]